MKAHLQQLLTDILKDMGVSDVAPDVSISEDPSHGDYTTNIAMKLAKPLKKSPMDIALQVKSLFEEAISLNSHRSIDQNIYKKDQKYSWLSEYSNVLQDISKLEVVAPGFLNVYVADSALSSRVHQALKAKERYGTASSGEKKQQTVMVEYTDPNPFKEFHIGHLYSNAVGESLARLHEAIGWKVIRVDYFGDVGMHVAKSIWGLERKMKDDKVTIEDLEKQPLPKRIEYLGQSYAKGATIYEEKTPEAEAAKEEMKDINYMVYLAAQEYMQKTLEWKPQVDYRQHVQVEDSVYQRVKKLFETGRTWSMDYFETIFRRLGTHFDDYYPESIVGEYGAKLVLEHVGKVFEKSDGAVVFRGAHTRVFLNSLGLPTYEAKELGLNWKKSQDYELDKSFIVTGNEINEYFKVVLAAMSQVVPQAAEKTHHIGHGMVRLPEGKMSSRTGKILSGTWLLEEVKKSIYSILEQNESKYNKVEKEGIAEKAAIAAIKYSLLRVALPANIAFDIDTSLSFDGDSGPYLLYTYARAKSVLLKDKEVKDVVTTDTPLNIEERLLARLISMYPEIVHEAATSLSPNKLCSYLFRLASTFNLFYQKHTIIGSPIRHALTAATAQVIQNGLYLLGIQTVERM